MDKISVCGTGAPGSTPGESTKIKSPCRAFNFALANSLGDYPGESAEELSALAGFSYA